MLGRSSLTHLFALAAMLAITACSGSSPDSGATATPGGGGAAGEGGGGVAGPNGGAPGAGKAGGPSTPATPPILPTNQKLLTGGEYIMTLTDGTDTFDFIIVPDDYVLDNSTPTGDRDVGNELDTVHVGNNLVAPPDPNFLNHIDTSKWAAACGYRDLIGGQSPQPCFNGTSVEPVQATSTAGKPVSGQMTWNALGFTRVVLSEPVHYDVVPAPIGGATTGVKVVKTKHVGLDVVFVDSGSKEIEFVEDIDFGAATLDKSGTNLFSQNGMTVSLDKASVTTKPKLRTALSIQNGTIHHLKFELEDDLVANLSIGFGASASYSRDIEKQIFSYSKTLPPQIIGGVPVVETVRLDLNAHCHVGVSAQVNATMGVTLSQHTVLGGDYVDGTWTNTSTVNAPTLTPIFPSWSASTTGNVTCDLTPQFSLLIYDLVGPYVSVTSSASLTLTASPTSSTLLDWTLDSEFSGTLGVQANPSIPFVASLNQTGLKDANMQLFDFKKKLLSGTYH